MKLKEYIENKDYKSINDYINDLYGENKTRHVLDALKFLTDVKDDIAFISYGDANFKDLITARYGRCSLMLKFPSADLTVKTPCVAAYTGVSGEIDKYSIINRDGIVFDVILKKQD